MCDQQVRGLTTCSRCTPHNVALSFACPALPCRYGHNGKDGYNIEGVPLLSSDTLAAHEVQRELVTSGMLQDPYDVDDMYYLNATGQMRLAVSPSACALTRMWLLCS